MRHFKIIIIVMLSLAVCNSFAEIKTVYDDSGNIKAEYEIDSNATKNGHYKTFFTDGRIKVKGQFNNGNQTGTWNYYAEDGSVAITQIYSDEGILIDTKHAKTQNNQIKTPIRPDQIKNHGNYHFTWGFFNLIISGVTLGIFIADNDHWSPIHTAGTIGVSIDMIHAISEISTGIRLYRYKNEIMK